MLCYSDIVGIEYDNMLWYYVFYNTINCMEGVYRV